VQEFPIYDVTWHSANVHADSALHRHTSPFIIEISLQQSMDKNGDYWDISEKIIEIRMPLCYADF